MIHQKIPEKAEVTETPDYTGSLAPPHSMALRQPPALAGQLGPPHLTPLRKIPHIGPFYNKSSSNMQLRPPWISPTPLFDNSLISVLTPTLHLLKLNPFNGSSCFFTSETRLLPDPRDTYLYPGRPYYDKRSRTKKMEKEE